MVEGLLGGIAFGFGAGLGGLVLLGLMALLERLLEKKRV